MYCPLKLNGLNGVWDPKWRHGNPGADNRRNPWAIRAQWFWNRRLHGLHLLQQGSHLGPFVLGGWSDNYDWVFLGGWGGKFGLNLGWGWILGWVWGLDLAYLVGLVGTKIYVLISWMGWEVKPIEKVHFSGLRCRGGWCWSFADLLCPRLVAHARHDPSIEKKNESWDASEMKKNTKVGGWMENGWLED